MHEQVFESINQLTAVRRLHEDSPQVTSVTKKKLDLGDDDVMNIAVASLVLQEHVQRRIVEQTMDMPSTGDVRGCSQIVVHKSGRARFSH